MAVIRMEYSGNQGAGMVYDSDQSADVEYDGVTSSTGDIGTCVIGDRGLAAPFIWTTLFAYSQKWFSLFPQAISEGGERTDVHLYCLLCNRCDWTPDMDTE